jgi:ABC-type amino acid transport substrate-binding protein
VKLHRMKLEIVTVPSFDAIIPALVDGRGDLSCGIIDTTARRKQVAFTSEVLLGPRMSAARAVRPRYSTAPSSRRGPAPAG